MSNVKPLTEGSVKGITKQNTNSRPSPPPPPPAPRPSK